MIYTLRIITDEEKKLWSRLRIRAAEMSGYRRVTIKDLIFRAVREFLEKEEGK